jgi:hypothetical protein
MYEHSFKTLVGNGDHIYGERGNCSWNGMLFSSKKALLLNPLYDLKHFEKVALKFGLHSSVIFLKCPK